jgi:hypothetical protein
MHLKFAVSHNKYCSQFVSALRVCLLHKLSHESILLVETFFRFSYLTSNESKYTLTFREVFTRPNLTKTEVV